MMDNVKEIKVHDVVQVNEHHEWQGCLVYVTEIRKWGVQGFVQIPLRGRAFIRLNSDQYEYIGPASIKITE